MAARFSEIWLLIGVVFVVHLPVIRCHLCPPEGMFHTFTGSCMALVRKNFTYGLAESYCPYNFRSSITKSDGHLVFIFDQATDDFVKGLLDAQGVDKAIIGLHDRDTNGHYVWGDISRILTNYTGWADKPHTPDFNKDAVVMTKDGWREYDRFSGGYFVCQFSVDFPTPGIVCPVAEVGQQSPSINCTTDTNKSDSITGVRFMKKTAVIGSCDANSCWSGQRYGHVADVSEPPETGRSAPWTLKLRNVSISDATDWTCSVEFNNSGYWVASQPCRLNVYKKPANIQCSHQVVQATVRTTCTAAQVYPHVGCSWNVYHGSQNLTVYKQTVSNDVDKADGYYRATCNASFNVTNAGIYNITVAMAPSQPNLQILEVKETIFSVEPPQQPPQLYQAGKILQSLWVKVVENQTLTLTCQVPGGDPPVYRTIITCDNIPQLFVSDGSSVTIDVRVTRELHGRNCTCSALHAARYTQTSRVEIRVFYPTNVTSFRISSRSSSASINSGDEITFNCTADGNPVSQLTVQRQNGHSLTKSSTGDVTYQKTATCSDTGNYDCLASNTVQGRFHQDSQVVHLQVRCAPEHCSGTSSISLPATVGSQSVSIKICVWAYPAPSSFSLYKVNMTINMLKADKFQAYFNFTNEEDGLGEITVMISPFTEEDIGDYMLSSGVMTLLSNLTFSLFAKASPLAPSGGVVTAVVATVITVLLVVIIVVAVVVVVRRRRGQMPKKSVYMIETDRTGAGDTSKAGYSEAGETSRLESNDNGGDSVYANTTIRGINTEGKNVKAAKKTSEEEDDSNTYAQVNKQDKKARKAKENPDKKKAREQAQESLYSRFTRNINLKGHKKQNTEQVYSELASVYQNVSNVGDPDTSAAADPDNVYANTKASSTNKQENTSGKKKNNYRTVNDDGLVYVSVEINKNTTCPEIVSANKPVGTVSPMNKQAEPEVEYIAINFSPGVKQQ